MSCSQSATTMILSATAPSARLAIARQFARRSRGEASSAASTSTGATNSVSASSGSRTSVGTPGMSASVARKRHQRRVGRADAPRDRGERRPAHQQCHHDLEHFHQLSRLRDVMLGEILEHGHELAGDLACSHSSAIAPLRYVLDARRLARGPSEQALSDSGTPTAAGSFRTRSDHGHVASQWRATLVRW